MENLDFVKPAPSGYCVFCCARTSLVCHRCGDFYCSKKCQLKDWQRHRYICFHIPALVQPLECSAFDGVEMPPEAEQVFHEATSKNAGSTAAKDIKKVDAAKKTEASAPSPLPTSAAPAINGSKNECDKTTLKDKVLENFAAAKPATNNTHSNNNNKTVSCNSTQKKTNLKITSPPLAAMPPTGSIVYVTSFRSPNRCFVRDASETAEKAYFDICHKVNMLGKELPKLQKLNIHGFALAKYNGFFQRVKVLAAQHNKNARLQYIDLGIIKPRNGAEMLEISSELLELPCYSLEVQLKDVPNYALNNELNGFLTQFEGGRFLANFDKHMELLHLEKQRSVNAEIREFCSNMLVFGGQPQAFEKKSTPPKTGAQQSDNYKHNLERQNGLNVIDITAQKCPTTPELKSNQNQSNSDTKWAQLAKAMEDKLNKDQPVDKQDAINVYTKLYLESTNAEAITIENVLEANKKDIVTNEPDAKIPTELKDSFKETQENAIVNSSNNIVKPNVEPLLIAPFEKQRFSTSGDKGLDVFIVDNTSISRGIIGAFDSTYARVFTDLHSRLSEFKDSQPYRPVLKEYVIAKFEDEWYRARVMEIKTKEFQSTYNVMYLEFTNTATVTEQDIRRYPADLTVPCHTSICLIEGFPHRPTKAQIEFLEDKLQMHSLLHIDSVSYLQDMALVKCKALLDELTKKL